MRFVFLLETILFINMSLIFVGAGWILYSFSVEHYEYKAICPLFGCCLIRLSNSNQACYGAHLMLGFCHKPFSSQAHMLLLASAACSLRFSSKRDQMCAFQDMGNLREESYATSLFFSCDF